MFGPLDLLILAAFIVYAVASGLRARKTASRNLEEYFLAGRSLSGWQAGISMAATQFAADTPLLVTGLVATAGIFALWRLWIYALAFLLMGFVLAGSWRRAGVLTDAELTELRYGGRPAAVLRGIKAIYFGTIFNCTVLAMVLLAATRIAEPFLLWNEWLPGGLFEPVRALVERIGMSFTIATGDAAQDWIRSANNVISISAIVGVTTLYSTTGGLRSVVQTDLVQFAIMMLGTLLFAVWAVHAAGGLAALPSRLHELLAAAPAGGMTVDQLLAFTPDRARDASFAVLAMLAIQWLAQMNADGTGYLAQRSMACRSDEDARLAAVVFTIAQIFFRSLLWIPICLALLVVFPPDFSLAEDAFKAGREATFVRGIAELLPTGLKGLMMTGMLAALASTVDTHLNWGASYWTHDIYGRFICRGLLKREPKGPTLVWVARGANLLILALALVIMGHLSSIQSAWQASLLLGAGMGVMLVLRWLWWRITAWGELAAIAASLVLAPLLLATVEGDATRLVLMAAGSTLAGIATSAATGPEPGEVPAAFYRRARPPGYWAPVASAAGDDPRASVLRLWRGLAATLLAALSIFCLLVGLGSWLFGSAAPVWLPWRGVWITLLLTAGIGLIPYWWRLGTVRETA